MYPGLILADASPAYWSSSAFVTGVNATTLVTDTTAAVVFRDNPTFPSGRDPSNVFDNTSNFFAAPSTTTFKMYVKLSLYNDSGTDSTATITLYNLTTDTTISTLGTKTVTSASTSNSPDIWYTTFNLSGTSGEHYQIRIRIGVGDTNLVYYLNNNSMPSCLWTAYW